ncbi:ABC transporter ATP-binding protein [Ktedonosporobacter rubrisoli]|uniref:ABC transporter ATP-binding protein n=1 Tax=Ktedonosporobacter rubrisoli TaxID=2509675 RepID=A0A4P6JQY4_KTERU|nr:ABC transporter ATP-binding protein [Ktedonosporobacter rubrisoli]QBD77600.1 ABC transporter ATP-binding protein [Ktedonosporobacter rubrisoli]
MAIIEVEAVTYTYPGSSTPSLRDVTFSVEPGEFVALIGANGAGKSTLCYALTGFVPHFFNGEMQGQVTIAGIQTQKAALEEIVPLAGLVFQNPITQLTGKATVCEEIAFGLENLGVPPEEMEERIAHALELVGDRSWADRSPTALSGGQQQRVALACMLVMKPQVLVLDEPTSFLDPLGAHEVFTAIRQLSREGMTIIIAEHNIEWIARETDRIIALDEGKIILDGKPSEVLTSPLLEDLGSQLRYTAAARLAQARGWWPETRNLPVTLEEAEAGFRAGGFHGH